MIYFILYKKFDPILVIQYFHPPKDILSPIEIFDKYDDDEDFDHACKVAGKWRAANQYENHFKISFYHSDMVYTLKKRYKLRNRNYYCK